MVNLCKTFQNMAVIVEEKKNVIGCFRALGVSLLNKLLSGAKTNQVVHTLQGPLQKNVIKGQDVGLNIPNYVAHLKAAL